jgi:HK97 family phage portal protein
MLNRNEPVRDFVKRLLSYYIVTGETFAEIVMNSVNSQPLGLIVMPSQFCKKIQGTRFNPINAIKYLEKGQEVEIPYNKVVHIFNPSLSNYFEELSPAIPLQEIISLNNSAITWNKNVAQSGGLPPFVVKAMGANKAQAQKIREEWMAQSGAQNSHLLKIISENMDIQKMNDSPHDAEWSQAVTATMRMIFMVLGMSSSLQNDAANKTYNNYHEARKSMYMENIIPLVELMLGAINRKLQMYYDDNPTLVVSREKIEAIQEERGQMIDRLVKAVDAGIITANEARKELALNPAKGASADILQNSRIINNIPKVDINNQDNADITTNTNNADENEG